MSGHYFDVDPTSPEHRTVVEADFADRSWEFETASGVFAKDGLDKATAILLDSCAPPAPGSRVLDLGSGWGPIACFLAHAGARTWAVDINPRARELTAANAQRHGLDVTVVAPEDIPEDLQFDEIWSNPPVRIGKAALHALLLEWLPRLTSEGRALLVVGKNLGSDSLQKWLTEQNWPTARLTSAKGFRILEVQRP